MFNVGDRVRVISFFDSHYGMTGKIVSINFDKCKVKFDDIPHSAGIFNQEEYFKYYELMKWENYNEKLKTEEDNEMFNVGDRVKIVGIIGNEFENKTGKIISIKQSGPFRYRVKLDCYHEEVNLERDELEKIQEYELNKPYLWTGGECPLPPNTKVMIRFGDTNMDHISEWVGPCDVSSVSWYHYFINKNVLFFKVVSYNDPKEVTMKLTDEEIKIIENVLNRKVE